MSNIIHINASRPYEVIVGAGNMNEIGEAITERFNYSTIAIFTDDIVDELYAGTVCDSLENAGLKWCKFVFPHGEQSKRLETMSDFISYMAENGITRQDAVLALGGGVCGDIGGLAAALYMRGIGLIQVPTTLLAMTDSSVGGKTAVDIEQGKNLIGAFYQPSMVWCDTSVLNTLPKNILRDGYAEVIKYGILFDRDFFNDLSTRTPRTDVVSASVQFKRDVVQADETDQGIRALLNLGHTIGHSVEKLSGYTLSHGEAVAIGMIRAARIAASDGFTDCSDNIKQKLHEFGFETACPYTSQEIYEAAMADKKRSIDGITLILPERIGKCGLFKYNNNRFLELLRQTELDGCSR